MMTAPHSFTLRQLQYAVAVAEERSFRRAAQRCRVSQPSLSSQLMQLESSLGARLFERDRRGVLITVAGEELLRRARRILVEADDLGEAATRFGDPLAGTVRVGVIPTVSPYLLPELAPRIRRALPRLRVIWTEERTTSLRAQLEAGELDAAIVALESDLGDVDVAEIGFDPFVVAVGAAHPLARGTRPLRAAELDPAQLLLLTDGHCLRDQAIDACGGVRAGAPFSATSLSTLAEMVAAGDGVTLLPSLALKTENRRGRMRLRKLVKPAPGRTLAVVWRRGSPAAVAATHIAELARAAWPVS